MSRDFNFTNIVWVSDKYVAQKQDDDRSFPDNKSECRPYAVITKKGKKNKITKIYLPLTTQPHNDGNGYMRVNDENKNFKFGISTLYNVTNIPAADIRHAPKNKDAITDERYELIEFEKKWFSNSSNVDLVIQRINDLRSTERKIAALKEEISRTKEETRKKEDGFFKKYDDYEERINELKKTLKALESDYSSQKIELDKSNELLKQEQEKTKKLENENKKQKKIINELLKKLGLTQEDLSSIDITEPVAEQLPNNSEPQETALTSVANKNINNTQQNDSEMHGPQSTGKPNPKTTRKGKDAHNNDSKLQERASTSESKQEENKDSKQATNSGNKSDNWLNEKKNALKTLYNLRSRCNTSLDKLENVENETFKNNMCTLYNNYLLPAINKWISQMNNESNDEIINKDILNRFNSIVAKTNGLSQNIAPVSNDPVEDSYISCVSDNFFKDINQIYQAVLEDKWDSFDSHYKFLKTRIKNFKASSKQVINGLQSQKDILGNNITRMKNITSVGDTINFFKFISSKINCWIKEIERNPKLKHRAKRHFPLINAGVQNALKLLTEITPLLACSTLNYDGSSPFQDIYNNFFDDIYKLYEKYIDFNSSIDITEDSTDTIKLYVDDFNNSMNNKIESFKKRFPAELNSILTSLIPMCKENLEKIPNSYFKAKMRELYKNYVYRGIDILINREGDLTLMKGSLGRYKNIAEKTKYIQETIAPLLTSDTHNDDKSKSIKNTYDSYFIDISTSYISYFGLQNKEIDLNSQINLKFQSLKNDILSIRQIIQKCEDNPKKIDNEYFKAKMSNLYTNYIYPRIDEIAKSNTKSAEIKCNIADVNSAVAMAMLIEKEIIPIFKDVLKNNNDSQYKNYADKFFENIFGLYKDCFKDAIKISDIVRKVPDYITRLTRQKTILDNITNLYNEKVYTKSDDPSTNQKNKVPFNKTSNCQEESPSEGNIPTPNTQSA